MLKRPFSMGLESQLQKMFSFKNEGLKQIGKEMSIMRKIVEGIIAKK